MALTPHRRFLSEAPVLTVSSLRSAPATADGWTACKARAERLDRDAASGRALGSILSVNKHPPHASNPSASWVWSCALLQSSVGVQPASAIFSFWLFDLGNYFLFLTSDF